MSDKVTTDTSPEVTKTPKIAKIYVFLCKYNTNRNYGSVDLIHSTSNIYYLRKSGESKVREVGVFNETSAALNEALRLLNAEFVEWLPQ